MPRANGQTGFYPPTRDAERRAFFDLLRRLKVLEDAPDGGGGGGETIIAGAGLVRTGDTLDVVPANGSLTVGADSVAVAYGGTGAAATAARSDHTHTALAEPFWKIPAYVATTANITLSGFQTIDGVDLTPIGIVRVLVKNQTNPAQNGIYSCDALAWTRVGDFDASGEVPGAVVYCKAGATQADTIWTVTAPDRFGAGIFTIGTDPITWTKFAGSGGAGADEVFIGPADPGAAYELWVDSDATPVAGAVVPTQMLSAAGSGSFLASGSPGGQVPGLQIGIPVQPFPRSVLAVCNIGLTWISGGANTYWVATFVWTGIAAGANRAFYWPRGPTGHGQGSSQVTINANAAATLTMYVTADVAASASVSGTWLDVMATPAGSLL